MERSAQRRALVLSVCIWLGTAACPYARAQQPSSGQMPPDAQKGEPMARMRGEPRSSGQTIGYQTQVEPLRPLSSDERLFLSLAAGRLLVHVDRAVREIGRNNAGRGHEEVGKALTLAKMIHRTAPFIHVTTEMNALGLGYKDVNEESLPVIRVLPTSERIAMLGPIVRAKARAGDPSISEARNGVMLSTSAHIDIAEARGALQKANDLLADKKQQEARDLLLAVQQGVHLGFLERDLPLAEAADSLARAYLSAHSANERDTRANLEAAGISLEMYEKNLGQTSSAELARVRERIDSAAGSVGGNWTEVAAKNQETQRQIGKMMV